MREERRAAPVGEEQLAASAQLCPGGEECATAPGGEEGTVVPFSVNLSCYLLSKSSANVGMIKAHLGKGSKLIMISFISACD